MSSHPWYLRPAEPKDRAAILALHDEAFGPGRFARTAHRIREQAGGRFAFEIVAEKNGTLIGAVQFTEITIGGKDGALLLGPLAVAGNHARQGLGRQLVLRGVKKAEAAGYALILLVGDFSYYGALNFTPVPPGKMRLPGPVDPKRLLMRPLTEDAPHKFHGVVRGKA